MLKKFLALLAVCVSASAAQATVSFTFDPDGVGGVAGADVSTFDFAPGNALADQVLLGSPVLLPGTQFNLYYQARLNIIQNSGGNPVFAHGLNVPGEITVVAGFREVVNSTDISGANVTTSFGLVPGAPNFLKFYYDPTPDANNLAGTGFDDGTLILDAGITSNTGGFTVNTAATPLPFDNFGANNYGGVTSVIGAGAVTLTASISFLDPTFFTSGLPAANLVIALFNSSNITPFSQVDPSGLFSPDGIVGGPTITPGIGALNGVSGPDFQFQADANASFDIVPEPASGLVFGALAICGALRFRRKSR